MNEVAFAFRMASQLGLRMEPGRNRVSTHGISPEDLEQIIGVMSAQQEQRNRLGRVKTRVWCQLLPWTSLN